MLLFCNTFLHRFKMPRFPSDRTLLGVPDWDEDEKIASEMMVEEMEMSDDNDGDNPDKLPKLELLRRRFRRVLKKVREVLEDEKALEEIWEKVPEKVPELIFQVLVCQSDMDITIKVSDQGGGVDRVTADKMFQYLYTTSPSPSLTAEAVPLSGFGYGLPLSRLYARC